MLENRLIAVVRINFPVLIVEMTLMRAMVDVHLAIRCGKETHIIPKMLTYRDPWRKSDKNFLLQSGITEKVLDSGILFGV